MNVQIQPYGVLVPHLRTANQTAVIYTANSGAQTALTIPAAATDAKFARIVPISGGDILVEVDGGGTTAHNVDLASTLLLSTATEHLIPLPASPSIKIAGKTGTATFQLTWVK